MSEPFFCPFCHDVLWDLLVEDWNHFVQCLVKHALWWTLRYRPIS